MESLDIEGKGYFYLFDDHLEFELDWKYEIEEENERLAIMETNKGTVFQKAYMFKDSVEAIFMEHDTSDNKYKIILERKSGRAYALSFKKYSVANENYEKIMNWIKTRTYG
tara:strand:+ start:23 stop:355 length:333 start_codon:yes stop_codon:yes gene_type:complete